jgi:hypothetical protein
MRRVTLRNSVTDLWDDSFLLSAKGSSIGNDASLVSTATGKLFLGKCKLPSSSPNNST